MIRVQQLRVPVGHTDEQLRRAAAVAAGIPVKDLLSLRVYRRGVDARHTRQIHFIYTVDLDVKDEVAALAKKRPNVSAVTEAPYAYAKKTVSLSRRPVVVGTGPAGLFAGLLLARSGTKPILLERGQPIEQRVKDVEGLTVRGVLNPESNIQFGEGGAGTFSDGKLNTSITDPRCRWVLEQLVAAGAPADILFRAKPHVGTDRLRGTVIRMRRDILEMGGEFRFGAKVTDLEIKDERVAGVRVNDAEWIEAEVVVMALGNAARDTFEMLHRRGVRMEPKPFSIGARVEHSRAAVDRGLYGGYANHPQLGAADYKMAHHSAKGMSAYTFCMCPGGVVVPGASEEGGVVTNGMSEYARCAANSNSGLMVGVTPADFGGDGPLAGVAFQRKWEQRAFELGGGGFRAPVQRVGDFLARRPTTRWGGVEPSYLPGATPANLWDCLPEKVCEGIKESLAEFNKRIKDFSHPDALLTGVETRSSSPVRMTRDEGLQSNLRGLYPVGEGAGHAGGIMSSAVDGLRAAEAILAAADVSA